MKLMPFQEDAVARLLTHLINRGGAFNACEQGLGKTIQTCAIINYLRPKKILIVVPPVVRLTFLDEVTKWVLPELREKVQVISSGKNVWDSDCQITIIGYSNLKAFLKDICKEQWELMVLDEAHYVKNLESQRARMVLLTIWPHTHMQLALSGTPITNDSTDLFNLCNKFAPEDFPKYRDFAGEYCYLRSTAWGDKYFGTRNTEKLNKIMNEKFFVRYTKEEALPDLPDKIIQKIILPEHYKVKVVSSDADQLEAQINAVLEVLRTGNPAPPTSYMSEVSATYRREQGEKKVPAVVEFCKMLLESGQSVVLFGYHKNVIKAYVEGLKEWKPQVITGEVSGDKARKEAVDTFQSGKSNLFIGQIKAAGIGITLLQKDKVNPPNVVLGEIDWSPAVVGQAIDRCHRIGVKDSVNVYYMLVKNSIDSTLVDAVMAKARDISKVIENNVDNSNLLT